MFKRCIGISVLMIVAVFFFGCGKKKGSAKKRKYEENVGKSFDNVIEKSFPDISDYIYPLAKLVSQKNLPVLKENKAYRRDLPDFMGTELIFETTDSVNSVADFFKKFLSAENFKYKQRGNEVKSVVYSHIKEETTVPGVPMDIQIKITSPASNFSKKVVGSQLTVIDKQITQYENYMAKHKSDYDSNSNQLSGTLQHCKEQIDRLKIQYSALSKNKTIIEVSLRYIFVNPKP